MQQNLFSPAQRQRQRQRYQKQQSDHDFLFQRAGEDIALRLHGITRDFPVALNLNASNGVISTVLEQASNVGKVLEADSLPPASPKENFTLTQTEELPFAQGSIDLVVSVLELHFINDLPGYLRQICTILKPDGLFLGALAGGMTLHELRTVLMQAEEEIAGGVSPRVIPFANIKDMGSLLQRAGFALPVADLDNFTVQYDNMFKLMSELKGMGSANILSERKKTPTARSVFLRAAALYEEQFSANGKISATCEIIHLTGWAPSPDQPKALKPGSAKTSLAQAVTSSTKR